MKCEIIRDLLPLYIENLCSEESCREVEKYKNKARTKD